MPDVGIVRVVVDVSMAQKLLGFLSNSPPGVLQTALAALLSFTNGRNSLSSPCAMCNQVELKVKGILG